MDHLEAVLNTVRFGFPDFAFHVLVTTLLWVGAMYVIGKVTPYRKMPLILEGNLAVTISYGGASMGMAIPLAFVLATSVSVIDIIVWGLVILLFQLAAFYITSLTIPDLAKRLEANEVAPALFLTMLRISFAFINAAAVT